jgi:hypothetical protein
MIRDVIIHMGGEQPLMADLRAMPTTLDTCLVCTNLRTRSNQRPIFIDASDSWFLIPLEHIRFVEILASSVAAGGDDVPGAEGLAAVGVASTDEELELDEDFLRRIKEA